MAIVRSLGILPSLSFSDAVGSPLVTYASSPATLCSKVGVAALAAPDGVGEAAAEAVGVGDAAGAAAAVGEAFVSSASAVVPLADTRTTAAPAKVSKRIFLRRFNIIWIVI